MKIAIISFIAIITFSIIVLCLNYKISGGDIFSLFAILSFALLEIIIIIVLSFFHKIEWLKVIIGIFSGLILSYFMFEVINFLSIK